MKTAPRLALLLLLASARPAQATAWSSQQVPLSDGHHLDVRFLWIFNPSSTDARSGLRAHIYTKSRDGLSLEMSPNARRPSPLKSFVLVGKWWTILGDFVRNAGVIWTYQDTFHVEDAAGKTYKIDRQALSKYPDLARRLRNATISFDKAEITVQGVARNGATVPVTFSLGGQDFLFSPEGATPYMAAPGASLKWSDSVRIDRVSAPQDDKSLRAQWASLVAIEDPSITITDLRIPERELAAIAKAYQEREEKDKDLEKEIAALNPEAPLPGDVGRYRGNDSFAEPFEETTAQVNRDPKTSEWMLRSKAGKTLATFGKEYWNLSALAGTKLFVLDGKAGKAIVNRRGERQSISGADTFRTVESKDGALTVETVFQPGVKVVDICNGNLGVYGPRLYSSSSEAIEIVNRAHRAWKEKKKQREQEPSGSRASRDEPTQVYICLTSSHWVTGIVRYRLAPGLRVTGTERGFLIESR